MMAECLKFPRLKKVLEWAEWDKNGTKMRDKMDKMG